MKKYLYALLADIDEAKNNRTKRSVSEDEIVPFELEDYLSGSDDYPNENISKSNDDGSIRAKMGLKAEQFPPADYWSEEEAAKLVIALNDLFDHYNLAADYPQNLPSHIAYTTLVGALEKCVPIMPFGTWHLEFCDYNTEECAFPKEYCSCLKRQQERDYTEGGDFLDFEKELE